MWNTCLQPFYIIIMIYSVSRKRSLIKSITWRTVASLDTFFIAWLVTGEYSWAGTIALLEILTKTFLYYFHERGWNYIFWGKYFNKNKKYKIMKKIFKKK